MKIGQNFEKYKNFSKFVSKWKNFEKKLTEN